MNTRRRPASRAKLGGHAAGAIVDQAVVAVTSLVLMILVRRQIGRAALGDYAILINALALLTALATAWVGDSLTVLDRFSYKLRQGLVASLVMFAGISIVVVQLLILSHATAQLPNTCSAPGPAAASEAAINSIIPKSSLRHRSRTPHGEPVHRSPAIGHPLGLDQPEHRAVPHILL